MNALEKQIKELKSQTEAPKQQIASKATQDGNNAETQLDDETYDSADSDSKSSPSNDEVQIENQTYISKFSRPGGRESAFAQGERLRTGTALHEAAPTTKATIPTTAAVLQPPIDTNTSQPEHPRPSITPYMVSTPFPGLAWPPPSQTQTHTPDWFWRHARAPEDLYEDMTSQCPVAADWEMEQAAEQKQRLTSGSHAGSTSICASSQAKSRQQGIENETPDSLFFEDTYTVQNYLGGHGRSLPGGGIGVPTPSTDSLSDRDPCGESCSFLSPNMTNELLAEDVYASPASQGLNTYSELKGKLEGQSLENRFEYLRLCLSSAGFSTFDSMASQYYTANFSHESIVSSEQRTSRQRQLPLLLVELRQHVKAWTQWEAHGYYDEIIKSAESIVRSERRGSAVAQRDYSNALLELAKPRQEAVDGAGNGSLSVALQSLMRVFQETTPKLLALVESLVGSSEASNQRQRFYTSLALMLLLNRPKQVPRRQMVTIMMNCLEMVYESSK